MSQTTEGLTLPAILKGIHREIARLSDCAIDELFPMPHATTELREGIRSSARRKLMELAAQAEAFGEIEAAKKAHRAAKAKGFPQIKRNTPIRVRYADRSA